jgi:predicted PurR-regulated permease PerM
MFIRRLETRGQAMKKLLAVVALAVLLVLVFAVVAQAAVSQATIDAIIKDAADGQIDGNWTAEEIRAALAYLRNQPIDQQYTETLGVLEEYLASMQAPGTQSGELAFTGAPLLLLLLGGAGLVGGGALLRRRGV